MIKEVNNDRDRTPIEIPFNHQIENALCCADVFAKIRPIAGRLFFVMKGLYHKDGSQEFSFTITIS